MSDTLAGRTALPTGPFACAVAPTASDTVDDPAGVSQSIVCTGTGGNIKVDLVGGGTVTLAIAAGWANRIPLRIKRVWSTGTTATGLMLLYVVAAAFNPFAVEHATSLAYVRPNYSEAGGVGTWVATVGDNLTSATGAPVALRGAPSFTAADARLLNGTSLPVWLGADDHHVVLVIDDLVVGPEGNLQYLWASADFTVSAWLTNTGGSLTLSYVVWDSGSTFTEIDIAVGTLLPRMVFQVKKTGGHLWAKVGTGDWLRGNPIGSTFLDDPDTFLEFGGDGFGDNILGTVPALAFYKAAQSDDFANSVVTWATTALAA